MGHGSSREQKLTLAVHQPPTSRHAKVLNPLGVVILDTTRLLEKFVYAFRAGVSSVERDRLASQHEHAREHRAQLDGIEEAKGAEADDVVELARSLYVVGCVSNYGAMKQEQIGRDVTCHDELLHGPKLDQLLVQRLDMWALQHVFTDINALDVGPDAVLVQDAPEVAHPAGHVKHGAVKGKVGRKVPLYLAQACYRPHVGVFRRQRGV